MRCLLPRAATRLAASLGVVAVLSGLSTTPAHAADEINIDHVQAADGKVSVLLAVDGLPDGATVDPDGVSLQVDGETVPVETKTVAAGDIARSTVLVLDASNSMQGGGKFEAAVAAVDAYLTAVPADVAVGLVTFAGDINEEIAPTTDREAIRSALSSLELAKGTSVYDAVLAGVGLVGDEGARSLLVLSDGGDTSSASTLEVAANDAEDAGVVVDVVSLDQADRLVPLTDSTGGRVIPADPAGLGTAFADQADALAHQLLVTFEPPEGTGSEVDIDVAVTAGGQGYTDSAFVSLGSALATTPDLVEPAKALVGKPVMFAGALALLLGLAGVLAIVLTRPTRSAAERRLDAYFSAQGGSAPGGHRAQSAPSGVTGLKDSAVAMTDKVVTKDLETRISQRLAGAGSALTASEWLLLHAGIAVGSAFVGYVLSGPLLAVLGLLLGIVVPWVYLKWRHGRRLNAFNGQLAQTLGLMAGGLQAGLSLPQAVDSVVREGHEPMAGELRRALVEQRLGIDISDALESVGHRMDSPDFGWVVMAIRIQREVGGNLAEILHTVADTLREREYLRRQVKALSAEGRLSGYILTGLPPLIGFYMTFTNPEYISLLYTTTPGYFILGLAVVLLGLGSFAMSKLAKVEV